MDTDIGAHRQPLLAHLLELRTRLIYSVAAILVLFCLAYWQADKIYAFLVQPLADTAGDTHRLIYTGLAEAFITYIKLAFWTACVVAFPFVACQIWMFIAPGLYRHERKAFLPFLIATPVLFLLGAALAYYGVMPLAWNFFLSFESAGGSGNLPIQLEPRVAEYLSLSMALIFAFGAAFELPVLMMILARVGILNAEKLVKARRYAIVGFFVVAAVITPPDVISQLCLAIPLMILYELSIIGVRMIEKKPEI